MTRIFLFLVCVVLASCGDSFTLSGFGPKRNAPIIDVSGNWEGTVSYHLKSPGSPPGPNPNDLVYKLGISMRLDQNDRLITGSVKIENCIAIAPIITGEIYRKDETNEHAIELRAESGDRYFELFGCDIHAQAPNNMSCLAGIVKGVGNCPPAGAFLPYLEANRI